MINRERLVKQFTDIVQIDSLTFKERKMADFLTKELKDIGLEVYEDRAWEKYDSEAGNIIGKLKGNKEGATQMFLAHMDRVEPGTGIKPMINGDMIKSKGDTILGADDCAGIVSILEALRVLKENNDTYSNIEVVFTIAEEGGLYGAKALEINKLESRIGFVFDSIGDVGTVITRAPAQDEFNVTIKGKASHAGVAPEEGINAIYAASLAIAQIEVGRIDWETTNNIGIINGGKATNVVPDYVKIQGETRSLNEKKVNEETQKIASIFAKTVVSVGAEVDFHFERAYSAFEIKEEEEVLKIAVKALKKIGVKPSLIAMGGGSDANILNQIGIRCLNFGIGAKKVHTTEEEISINNLEKAALLCHTLMSI